MDLVDWMNLIDYKVSKDLPVEFSIVISNKNFKNNLSTT
jgi:hypothetical protein